MKNLIQSTTELAMSIVVQYIQPGCLIIDATCGNGHDTLRLAESALCVSGSSKGSSSETSSGCRILGIDLQEVSIENTCALLIENGWHPQVLSSEWQNDSVPAADSAPILLAQTSHENIKSLAARFQQDVCLVVFNLGYLPGGDKTVTTDAGSTLAAVRSALELLMRDGLVCITMYSGHPAGKKEKQALLDFAKELDARTYHVSYINMLNQQNDPPEILLITRKR